jgi:predicted O-methyltransferase YrrM
MDILNPAITRYLNELASSDDEAVLIEMERRAEENRFPIIGRLCGRVLELFALAIGARRVFEMGSGYGYSAYWFSRAVGPSGELHLTDMDPENEKLALEYLRRAGLDAPVRYHVASALEAFGAVGGEFDIVYCDINKDGYPETWEAAKSRVRVGGMFICDNMLWSGRVTGESDEEDTHPDWTRAIDATNRAIEADPDYRAVIVPIRDGVVAAIRVR